MARQNINTGTTANDGTGDKLNVAFGKVNQNFTDLYSIKEDAITAGTSSQYWRGDKTMAPHNVASVTGLQTELDAKVPKGGITASGLTTNSGILLGRKTTGSGAIENLDPGEARTLLSLDNVSNTSDANKPLSTAASTALAGKEATITAGGAGQYWRGDKTFQDLNRAAVGLGNVDNTSDANKPLSTQMTSALALKLNTADLPQSRSFHWAKAQTLVTQVVTDAWTISAANSVARCLVAATAQTTFTVNRNNSSIGTLVFMAGATTGTLTLTSTTLARGDILDLTPPGSQDATLDRVALVLHN